MRQAGLNVVWLGQSGYLLEGGGVRIAIDPYLSDAVERAQGLKRLVVPPLTVAQLAPDALVITHDHLDHYDPDTVPAIMSAFPACRLAGPASVRGHGARDGIAGPRLVPLDAGGSARLGGFDVIATPARHSDPAAVGLLVRAGSVLLWFSGDTLYGPELAGQILRLAGRAPDAAFVCMNGRLGNMGIDDAVRLLAELRPGVAVPSHYGMFAENTAAPAEFVAACARAGLRAMVMEHGNPASGFLEGRATRGRSPRLSGPIVRARGSSPLQCTENVAAAPMEGRATRGRDPASRGSVERPAGPRALPDRMAGGTGTGADRSVCPTADASNTGRDGLRRAQPSDDPAVRGSGFRGDGLHGAECDRQSLK